MAESVNHKCVQRLMQKMGLRALIRAKKRVQNVLGLGDVHVPNILQRDFFAKAPNQKWLTDITEFTVHGQKLYLLACVTFTTVRSARTAWPSGPCLTWCLTRFEKPLPGSDCSSHLSVHSDQGWHYKMQPYLAMLAHHGVRQSMSRRGNCFDKAVIASFFGTLRPSASILLRFMESRHLKWACTITSATTPASALSSDCKGSARWNTG